MSPEQARGKTVDKRTDVWALGCVLYEMLSGRRAFDGEEVSDTLAAILKTDVDLSRLPPGTPPRVRQAIAACLQRDPKQRIRDLGDYYERSGGNKVWDLAPDGRFLMKKTLRAEYVVNVVLNWQEELKRRVPAR